MLRWKHEKTEATRYTLDIKGNVQEYALSLLHIINNAREYPHMIYKVENTYSNAVYITCDKRRETAVKEYLMEFGEITDTETVNWITVYAEYDSRGWDELYSNDNEVDFTVVFE